MIQTPHSTSSKLAIMDSCDFCNDIIVSTKILEMGDVLIIRAQYIETYVLVHDNT